MPRSKSSHRWLKEHFDDPFVKKSQQEGYRSRAVYKLIEIQEKDQVVKSGMVVVDLGAAPGGWSQYLAKIVGSKGRVVALDILAMDPLPGVEFIQGDFMAEETYAALMTLIGDVGVDVVTSDIAPNLSGMREVDIPRAMYLAELAVEFSKQVLKPGGKLLIKVFQGEGFDNLMKSLRVNFAAVKTRKPEASRSRSNEVYLLAVGFR
ncbi:MAG: 23S rRNA (uridine(2552)-2'-O)-methyltransferase RlmE [Gammaproteobacteria bacterium]|nr:23S rRNA (uridine(2552)-2'-O)-methyltransferase RlmE [Gammaproteobacteria bacterium]